MSLEEILNETTKLADLQALVAEHDEFKKLRKKAKKIKGLHGPRELKPLMYKALGVEAPAKQKRKPKKDKTPRYTRIDSVSDCIKKFGKKGFSMDKLVHESNVLYLKKTGEKDTGVLPKRFSNTHNIMCQALIAFDVLEKDGDTYKLV
jgi:hypothetical protein